VHAVTPQWVREQDTNTDHTGTTKATDASLHSVDGGQLSEAEGTDSSVAV